LEIVGVGLLVGRLVAPLALPVYCPENACIALKARNQ